MRKKVTLKHPAHATLAAASWSGTKNPARPGCQHHALALAITTGLALGMQSGAQAQLFPAEINLSDLNGSNGVVFNGEAVSDRSGYSVSAAGDINGDGIDDLIIGASNADPNGNGNDGRSYVVFGSASGLPSPFNLSSLNGLNGFVLNGEAAADYSGVSVSAAGDINGDGIDDLVIGAYRADPNSNSRAGRSYVVFGSDTGLPNPLNLSSLNGLNGFVLNGEAAYDGSGRSVSAAGDINGDGIDDLIIGAYLADPKGNSAAGRSYVVFGSDTGLPNPLNLSSLNGLNGFVLNGEAAGDYSGRSVSAAGDINGDGIDDLIIGADGADANGNEYAGRSYVVFGRQLVSELAIRMRDCRDPTRPGGTIEYGIQISNQGPDDAAEVLLESILPAGLSLLSASPGGLCTETGGNLSCNIGSVAADTVFSLGLVVSVGAGLSGPVSTSVTIATENADNPINNVATETTTVLGDLLFLDGGEKCGP